MRSRIRSKLDNYYYPCEKSTVKYTCFPSYSKGVLKELLCRVLFRSAFLSGNVGMFCYLGSRHRIRLRIKNLKIKSKVFH